MNSSESSGCVHLRFWLRDQRAPSEATLADPDTPLDSLVAGSEPTTQN